MTEIKKIIIPQQLKFTLTTLTKFLNENFEKKSIGRTIFSKVFTISDVQGYIKRGVLPFYLKEGVLINIERVECSDIPELKLYRLKEVELDKENIV